MMILEAYFSHSLNNKKNSKFDFRLSNPYMSSQTKIASDVFPKTAFQKKSVNDQKHFFNGQIRKKSLSF